MARFSEEWLAQLLDKNDIADVIGEYVHLEKRERAFGRMPLARRTKPFFLCNSGETDVLLFFLQKGRWSD